VKIITNLLLVPRSRIREAIPPLPQYAFMTWYSVRGSTGTTLQNYCFHWRIVSLWIRSHSKNKINFMEINSKHENNVA